MANSQSENTSNTIQTGGIVFRVLHSGGQVVLHVQEAHIRGVHSKQLYGSCSILYQSRLGLMHDAGLKLRDAPSLLCNYNGTDALHLYELVHEALHRDTQNRKKINEMSLMKATLGYHRAFSWLAQHHGLQVPEECIDQLGACHIAPK